MAPVRQKVAESDPMRGENAASKAIINGSSFWSQVPKECAAFQVLKSFVTVLKRKKRTNTKWNNLAKRGGIIIQSGVLFSHKKYFIALKIQLQPKDASY